MARRGWGQGQVVRAPSGSWGYRWREGGRRRFQGGFPSKVLAERALAVKLGVLAYSLAGVTPDLRSQPSIGALAPDYLARREKTHRAGRLDRQRWALHLASTFDRLRPGEVTVAVLRAWVEDCRGRGLSGSTIKVMLAALSGLFVELQEQGIVQGNPTRGLPPSIRRRLRSDHDPRAVPFLERLEDVRRVLLALPRHVQRPFALGVYAGLRPGEARALRWAAVDLAGGFIHVREQVTGPLKDRESRVVPILDPILPLLREWHVASGGRGLVCPPGKHQAGTVHLDRTAPLRALPAVLAELGLARPGLNWYRATRHTFASQWVLAGGSVKMLADVLGHSSVVVTERYAHLRPDLFGDSVRSILGTGRAMGTPAEVAQLPAATRKRGR